MNDLDTADPNIQTAILEAFAEGISAAVLLYDKNDMLVFASPQLAALLRVSPALLSAGTRMRDLLTAMYDGGIRLASETFAYRKGLSREHWISEQISGLWKERTETIERPADGRWMRVVKRRLSSGFGICVVKDVTDEKKREEQWRLDTERVQITEEVLDNLPFPISVKDKNATFVAINKANCDFLDLPADAILGHTGSDINPPALEQRLVDINREVMESGLPVRLPERIIRPDGSTVTVFVHKYRIGRPGRYYLVTLKQDISDVADSEGDDPRLDDFIEIDLTRKADAPEMAIELPAGKVLVVTADPQAEANAMRILRQGGVDVSCVSSDGELMLFLQLATEADIRIDLVVIDAAMPAECQQVAEAHGVMALVLEPKSFDRNLARLVRDGLQGADDGIAPAMDDDWVPSFQPNEREIDILVAEDNEVNQIVFSQILDSLGYRYILAADGEEAVRLWRERSPRLVLMDVTLPKLTGFEASAAIRALEDGVTQVPIVGVLPHAFDRDREACHAVGMDDVILKPISPEALDTVIRRFLEPVEGISVHSRNQGAETARFS